MVLSLAFGPEVFDAFLKGMAAEDALACEKDPLKNPEMLDALIGVYERNVQGYPMPYSRIHRHFPDFRLIFSRPIWNQTENP